MFKEFTAFISKGNVIDLAVAVILGTAFSAIISSVVNDLIMPIIGIVVGGVNFSGLSIQVGEATIKYGMFVQALFHFLLIAACLFAIVKSYNTFIKKPKPATPPAKPEPTPSEKLLSEIRDLLKSKS